MSREEFLKIQTCVLKVNIHCEGCKDKVKKILQKIEGVYTIKIDSEQGKVTVAGNVDSATLIKKLSKNGKHAELWGGNKGGNNMNNQFKNLQIEGGKSKGQQQQPKGGQNLPQGKKGGLQDFKLPPQMIKGPKPGPGKESKAVKISFPEDEGLSDDDSDDYDYDELDDDDEDDDFDDVVVPGNKMKPGGPQMPMPMQNAGKGAGGGGNGKKGGGGNVVNHGSGNGGNKKGGNGNNHGGKQSQGGGFGGGKGGKNDGGGGNAGGGQNKNGNNGNGFSANGPKKGEMMPNVMGMNGGPGLDPARMASMPMGGNMSNPAMMGGRMGNLPTVQGLPAGAAGRGGGPGFFQGAGAGQMQAAASGNPYYQQQLAAMMMNQQHANGNERFQPMMYARPPAAVNYVPPSPYNYAPPYPYPPPPGDRPDDYAMFSDENASSCTVM